MTAPDPPSSPPVDRGDICDRFLDSLTYDLYPFQEEALLAWFESEGGVLVAAPTGMGKTLIAEAAIFEALHSGRSLYYTTPLIALTDQKFRAFQDAAETWGFPRESIGLITGNRRVNPDAPIRVVVAEILLNHLLSPEESLSGVGGVVMDEFHYFNDSERGVVWELSLVLLPQQVRLMLLSATVGNAVEFAHWAAEQHERRLRIIQSDQRRVPLAFHWVEDKLLTELLPAMVSPDDAENRTPALVFCFNRDECWEVAERLKGLPLIDQGTRAEIERLNADLREQLAERT
ncbi:MAG: DEAD/DEAH box helicase, partial [Phycisphaerae bacterium]